MDRPLELAFHNVDHSDSLEAEIRRHVDRLDERYPHLIGCRVSVEGSHTQAGTAKDVNVHVVLSVNGRELAISREPHRGKEKRAHPDAHSAVKDAFKAAERQLDHLKGKLRDDTTKPSGSAVGGAITLIEPGQDHGYLLTSTGSQLYFHRDSVTTGRFEDLREGQAVHYVEEEGDAGPVATKVRVALGSEG